jgi:hypothetical protein
MVLFVPIFEIEEFKKQIVFLFNSIKDPKYIQLHIKRLGIFEFEDFDYVPRECQFCINENHSKHKNAYAKEILKNIFFSDYQPLYLRYFQNNGYDYFLKWFYLYGNVKYKQIESVLSHFVVFG